MISPLRIAALALFLAPYASGQVLEDVYMRGQPLPGGSEVSTTAPQPIPFAQVHSNGDIFAFVHTESEKDILIYDGQVIAQEGVPDPFNGISNNTLKDILHAYFTESELLAWIVNLEFSDGNPDAEVVAVENRVILMEGMPVGLPGIPNATWSSFDFVHLTEDHSQLTVQGTVLSSSISIPSRRVRVVFFLDNNFSIAALERVVYQGGALVGLPTGVGLDSFRGEWAQFQPSESGRQIFSGDYTSGGPASGVWEMDAALNSPRVLITATGSNVPGLGMINRVVDTGHSITDFGKKAYVVNVTPASGPLNDVDILIKNSTPWVSPPFQQPALPGYNMVSFDECAVQMSLEDEVFWMGNYQNTANAANTARMIFRELDPLVIAGVTQVNQDVITAIDPWGGAFDISTTGEYMIFSGELEGDFTLFRYRLVDEYESFCFGDGGTSSGCTSCPCSNDSPIPGSGGCVNSAGTSALLFDTGRAAISGDSLRFRVEDATPNSFGILVSAQNKLPNQGPCAPGSGVTSPVIDGLRCVGGGLIRHGARATNSTGGIGIGNNGWGPPHGPSGGLVQQGGFSAGQTRHFQCFYRDNVDAGCMRGQNTTNAISVQVAP